MALVFPVLLLMILGIATVGHAMVIRFVLSSTAYDAARTCGLARQVNSKCVRTVVRRKMRDTQRWCNGGSGPRITAQALGDPNYPSVNTFEVGLNCQYGFGIGGGYLRSQGLVITNIEAKAVMPY